MHGLVKKPRVNRCRCRVSIVFNQTAPKNLKAASSPPETLTDIELAARFFLTRADFDRSRNCLTGIKGRFILSLNKKRRIVLN